MKNWGLGSHVAADSRFAFKPAEAPEAIYTRRVTAEDIAEMESAVGLDRLPWDFEEKLRELAKGDLLHSAIAQNCRLFLSFCRAVRNGTFKLIEREAYDRVLVALAYVRKYDDVIPDDEKNGYTDDFHLVKLTALELAPLLERFKSWRLRHQVPLIWNARPASV